MIRLSIENENDSCYKELSLREKGLITFGIHGIDPLGYLDFLSLMISGPLIITDSGGIQEETTFLGIPCSTLRDTTEQPITLTEGQMSCSRMILKNRE
jgi:UDP-N-acetylglucosamine 2-epimerase